MPLHGQHVEVQKIRIATKQTLNKDRAEGSLQPRRTLRLPASSMIAPSDADEVVWADEAAVNGAKPASFATLNRIPLMPKVRLCHLIGALVSTTPIVDICTLICIIVAVLRRRFP